MSEFDESQMLCDGWEVGGELRDEAGDVQVGVYTVGEREVVRLGQDLDAVGEVALTADTLLEGCTRCTTAVHFTVEKGLDDQLG